MKPERIAITVVVTIAAVGALVALVFLDRWVELVPAVFQWHTAALVSGLALGVFLWLKKPPSLGSSTPTRRRGRLRDRYRAPADDEE